MPKAILEFKLPEETTEYEMAVRAGKYHAAIWGMNNYLRALLKHDGYREERLHAKTLERVREKLWEFIGEQNVGEDF